MNATPGATCYCTGEAHEWGSRDGCRPDGWPPPVTSTIGQPPGEDRLGRYAAESIATLAAHLAAAFPDELDGHATTVETIVRLLDELATRRRDANQVAQLRDAAAYLRRSDDPISGPLADWLDGHARDLDMAFGRTSSVDSPGDLEHATKIARAILGLAR